MNTEGCVLNHTGDIDWHREHKKHASYPRSDRQGEKGPHHRSFVLSLQNSSFFLTSNFRDPLNRFLVPSLSTRPHTS